MARAAPLLMAQVLVLTATSVSVAIAAAGVQLNRAPQFLAGGDMARFSLPEDTPVGAPVYRLRAVDPEGSAVHFSISGQHLTVDRISGIVSLIKPLDRETQDLLEVVISVIDEGLAGTDPNTVSIRREIPVLDVNDNPPVFQGRPYAFNVSEATKVGTRLFSSIVVSDADGGVNAEVTVTCDSSFSLNSNEESRSDDGCSRFAIETEKVGYGRYSASILLIAPLDFERRSAYSLTLRATDGATDPGRQLSTTAPVAIRVIDVQDQPPVFLNAPYSAAVAENTLPGTLVAEIQARDGDLGESRPLLLTLEGDDLGFFELEEVSVDPSTGLTKARLVTSLNPLDREHSRVLLNGGIYSFTIKATELINNELPGDWSSTPVTIVVTDVNDQLPRFNQDHFYVNVSEDIEVGSPLPGLNMVVTDNDVGENARYALSIRDVRHSKGLFTVQPDAGVGRTPVVVRVRSKEGLDYDVKDSDKRKIQFDIVVHATDETGDEVEVGTSRVVVQLLDANDHAPTFSKQAYRVEVSEAAEIGERVLNASATDMDSGKFGQISYALRGFGAEKFRTDVNNGGLFVAQGLDYEMEQSYSLSLEARDGGGRVSTVNVFVDVIDENDNMPKFDQKWYGRTVREGATAFQPAMFIRATDVDGPTQGGGKVIYSLESSNAVDENGEHVLAVEPLSGEVRIMRAVSAAHTPQGQYGLTVRATDAGNPPLYSEAAITIRVGVPGNQRPVFRSPTATGSFAGALYHAEVREDASPDSPVVQVVASDPDGQDSLLTYSIASGARDNFNVDAKSGQITVSPEARLDPDATGLWRYQLTVLAVDSGLPVRETASAVVEVNIVDVNNKPPTFNLSDPTVYTRHVTESAPIGTSVMFVKALDPDSDAKLEYSIIEPVKAVDKTGVATSTNYNVREAFRINSTTGEIVVNSRLDHQEAAVVSLMIQARDLNAVYNKEKQVARVEVTIFVQAFSDGNPVFTVGGWTPSYPVIRINLPEEEPIGTVLITLAAVDPQAENKPVRQFQMAVQRGGNIPDWISVGALSGHLVLEKSLDYESLTEKVLKVPVQAVSDDLRHTSQAMIEVHVQDINDHGPVFSQPSYHTSVLESTRHPSTIMVITATDGDEASTADNPSGYGDIRYSLGGESASLFNIDSLTGTIQVAQSAILDRERQSHLKFNVIATDTPSGGTNQRRSVAQVTVDILDVNDNAPIFSKKMYSTVVPENVPIGTGVLNLTATDPDEGEGGEITYELFDQGELNGFFTIDPVKGQLRTQAALTGKGRSTPYTLRVRAQDNGDPPFLSDTTVVVYIGDVVSNDGVPHFVHPTLEEVAHVSENASVGSPVFRVQATDPDDPKTPEGKVIYKFLDDGKVGGDASSFTINVNSGLITTRAPLDRETKDKYSLLLVAADMGAIPQQSTRVLTVHVTDVDDHKPVFKRSLDEQPLLMKIPEELPVGTEVGQLSAIDQDIGENAQVDYLITYGNEMDLFSVSRTEDNKAVLKVARRLDREVSAEHLLTLKCFKKSARPQSLRKPYNRQDPSERQVKVIVTDVDDNVPKFSKDNVTIGVRLNVPADTILVTLQATDNDADAAEISYKLVNVTFAPVSPSLDIGWFGAVDPTLAFMLDNRTGELRTATSMTPYVDGFFTLKVIANNTADRAKQATAHIKVYIVRDRALLKFVFAKPPSETHRLLPDFQRAVEKALLLPVQLNVYDTQFYAKQDGSFDFSRTSSCFQLVGKETYDLSDMETLLKDSNNDELRKVYNKYHVQTVQRCAPPVNKAEVSWIQMCVLAIAAFIGLASLIASCVICCSYSKWERFR